MKKIVTSGSEQERALVELTADEQRGIVGGMDAEDIPFCGNGLPHLPMPSAQSLVQQVVLPATAVLGFRV
jgi:hypothetical protein